MVSSEDRGWIQAGEMALRLRALAALAEDPGFSSQKQTAGFALSLAGRSRSLTRFLKSAATSRVNTAKFRKPVDSSWLFWDR